MVRRLVIGSTAMGLHLPEARNPKDLDVFSPDWEIDAEVFWDDAFEEWIPPGTDRCASLNELYTIKVSHAFWELHGTWNKHMADVVALRRAGAQLLPILYPVLYDVWARRYGSKNRLDLAQSKDAFFSDAVTRLYDHDSIHVSVAYGDRPLFESVLKDGAEVEMDMRKVWALPFEDRVRLFREEVYATALERLIIPSGYEYSPRRAYAYALRKTVTSLTKGRSALFLVENYEIFRAPDVNYVARHRSRADMLIPLEEQK